MTAPDRTPVDVYWPDFDVETFTQTLGGYGSCQRRFGGRFAVGPSFYP
jgi:hypothetical protein